jgi:hypothetical protein
MAWMTRVLTEEYEGMRTPMTVNSDDDNIEVLPGLEAAGSAGSDGQRSVTDLVEQPAKVMRIGTMIKQLLEHS